MAKEKKVKLETYNVKAPFKEFGSVDNLSKHGKGFAKSASASAKEFVLLTGSFAVWFGFVVAEGVRALRDKNTRRRS